MALAHKKHHPEKAWLTAALMAAMSLGVSGAAQAEGGVMSLDFCADQYVLAFADRGDIASVSFEAEGENSLFSHRANGLHHNMGSIEEVLTMRPDLVVRTWRGSRASDALALRLGIETFLPPYALSQEDNLKNLRVAAEAVGGADKAGVMIKDLRARWDALKAAPKIPLKAVYMTPSGFTAGMGTFVDDIIRLAGFETVAKEAGIKGWVPLPLEKMIISPPDVVIGSFFLEGKVHVSHWSSGRHGAFRDLMDEKPTIMVPSSYLSCGGSFFVDAAEFIRREATRLGLVPMTEKPETENPTTEHSEKENGS